MERRREEPVNDGRSEVDEEAGGSKRGLGQTSQIDASKKERAERPPVLQLHFGGLGLSEGFHLQFEITEPAKGPDLSPLCK